ncbi:MAG: outer membrane beta-barrel protein, partial [Duganella sp.]
MKNTILFAMLAALAGSAAAQSQGAYVGGNVGRAEQKASVDDFGSEKDTDTGFKLYGGYNFTQSFGLEAGYADLGKLERSAFGDSISLEPTSVYFAATGTLPLDAQFSLFGKAGVARTEVKGSESFDGIRTSGKESRNSGYFAVGAAYAVNNNFSVVAEYENFGK